MAREFLCWLHPEGRPEKWTTNPVGVRNENGKVVPACQECAVALRDDSRIADVGLLDASGVELSDIGILVAAQSGRLEDVPTLGYLLDDQPVDTDTMRQVDQLRREELLEPADPEASRSLLRPTQEGAALIVMTEGTS